MLMKMQQLNLPDYLARSSGFYPKFYLHFYSNTYAKEGAVTPHACSVVAP